MDSKVEPEQQQQQQPMAATATAGTVTSRFQQAAARAVIRSRMRVELDKFVEETSLPGVSKAGVRSGRGLVWSALLVLSLVALLAHLCVIVSVYLRYSTTTSSSYDQRFEWPDVTLCNLVSLSVSAVERQESVNDSLGSFIAAVPTLAAQLAAGSGPVANSQDLRELMVRSRNLTEVAHRLNNSLLSCRYRGTDCLASGGSIRQTYVPRFHTCYTVSVPQIGSIGALADDDFLDLMLFVESGVLSYWDKRTLADFSPAGKVFVHARGAYPEVEDILDLPTGAWVMLGLSYTERNNYEGRCRKYDSGASVQYSPASGEQLFSAPADRRSCLESSMQSELARRCGCISEKLRRFAQQADSPGCHAVTDNAVVTAAERERARCHSGALSDALKAATVACPADCRERSWAIRVSPHVWPKLDASVSALFAAYATPALTERGFDARLLQVNGTNVTELNAKAQMEFVQRSFLRITVNPTSTTGLRIDESLVYTAGNLLSDLGGILGLYLGFSIIFLYEIAFLLVKLVSSRGEAGGGVAGSKDVKATA